MRECRLQIVSLISCSANEKTDLRRTFLPLASLNKPLKVATLEYMAFFTFKIKYGAYFYSEFVLNVLTLKGEITQIKIKKWMGAAI